MSLTRRPPLPPAYIAGTELTPGHSVEGRTMSKKNSNDNTGKGTSDLPVCSAVPQPTAPPGASIKIIIGK